ncbi:MAG: DUF2459 domain-containing protein [Bacteroidota bacterium]
MSLTVKKVSRFLLKLFLGIVSLLLLYFLLGFLLSYLPIHRKAVNCETHQDLYASTNGIHADLILPISQIEPALLTQLDVRPQTTHVGFGWGDKKFYLETPNWSDLKFSTALQAMFWKSETAMHITYYNGTYTHWKRRQICSSQNEALNAFLFASFTQTSNAEIQRLADGYGSKDEFYEAQGNYSCFKTCNGWVNQGLKKAKIETAIWTPFDFGVLRYFE